MVSGRSIPAVVAEAFRWGTTEFLIKEADYSQRIPQISKEVYARFMSSVENLKKFRILFSDLFNGAMVPLWVLDLKGRILMANNSAIQLGGRTMDDLRDTKLSDLLTEESVGIFTDQIENMASGKGHMDTIEVGFKKYDGSIIPLELKSNIISLEEAFPVAIEIAGIDLSRLKSMAKDQNRMKDKLIYLGMSWIIGRMIGGIAHEINNLLGAILGFTQLLMAELDEKDPIFSDLKEIEAHSQRCKKLVDNLSVFCMRQKDVPVLSDICEVIRDSLDLARNLLKYNFKVNLDLPEEVPKLLLRKEEIKQLLLCLILNAVDNMHKGGTIKLSCGLCDDYIRIYFEDLSSSIRLPPQMPLEEFQDAEKLDSSKLCLYMSSVICEKNGAKSTVSTVPYIGSAVEILLPVSRSE